MKLNRKFLVKEVTPVFESAGFLSFKEPGLKGFFVKKVSDDFYMCGSPIIHRFYDDSFTLDLYYANHLAMYVFNYDMPFDACIRIGRYLSETERLDNFGESPADHWWSLFTKDEKVNEDVITQLDYLLKLVIPRIVSNNDLTVRIKNSKRAESLANEELSTLVCFEDKSFRKDLRFTPKTSKKKNSIPSEWYMAAETILADKDDSISEGDVSHLAERAFCRHRADLAYFKQKFI